MADPNAAKLRKLASLQRKIIGHADAIPSLVAERDEILFDLIASDVSERRIAKETGITRGAIFQAKKRRTMRDA